MDFVELDRRAVRQSADLVAKLGDDQWDRPTPCGKWDLRHLLAHMTAHHNGFAAAAGGETADESAWVETPLDDPRDAYAESVERVLAAFAAPGVLDRGLWLPPIRREGPIPARMAISFHLVDYVVHTWDVGATVGEPPTFDDDLLAATEEVTRRFVPDGPARRLPDASFAPPVPEQPGWSRQERLLAALGRSPSWPS